MPSDSDPLLIDPATGQAYPEHIQREIRRYIKQAAIQDLLDADWGSMKSLVRYSIALSVAEDDDLCDLEKYRKLLVTFGRTLLAMPDALRDLPWTRVPRCWGWNGTIANLTGGESRLLFGLTTIVDPRTLTTNATLETMAALIDRSWDRTRGNLYGLKKKGLVKRWPIRHPNPNDEHHYLWITQLNTQTMTEAEYRSAAGPKDALAAVF